MRPTTISLTGNGSAQQSTPIVVDWRKHDISLSVDHGGSTTGFGVEFTLDAPSDYTDADAYNSDAHWQAVADMSDLTADAHAHIDFPVRALRLTANATGTDSATLTIVQGC